MEDLHMSQNGFIKVPGADGDPARWVMREDAKSSIIAKKAICEVTPKTEVVLMDLDEDKTA